jgi:surface polysaccharide O-acyltransferase-like enzyme
MTLYKTFRPILKTVLIATVSIAISFGLSFLTQTIILHIFPKVSSINNYHSKVFIPIFAFFFSLFFVIGGTLIINFKPILTAVVFSLISMALASLNLYQLAFINKNPYKQSTDIPFYAALVAIICAIIFAILFENAKKKRKKKPK